MPMLTVAYLRGCRPAATFQPAPGHLKQTSGVIRLRNACGVPP